MPPVYFVNFALQILSKKASFEKKKTLYKHTGEYYLFWRFYMIIDAKKIQASRRIITYARSIMQKGNKEQRFIVSGFTGPNLDLSYFKKLSNANFWGIRPVVKGFHQYLEGFACTKNPQGRMRFLSKFDNMRLKRHVVLDNSNTSRVVVAGFENSSEVTNIFKASQSLNKPIQAKELLAQERVVVRGFNTNIDNVIKKMDLDNSTEVVVIKGFSA